MNFTPIDLMTGPRGQMFYYFSKMAPTGYSMTVELDVTEFREITKRNGIKFFPAYLWLITRNLNKQIEFRIAEKDGVLCQPETPPPANAYTVSCVPWVSFTHFAVYSFENKPYYFPSVEAGQFVQKNGRTIMPLSLTCHHAATDGYHIKCFLENLEEDMARFEEYL